MNHKKILVVYLGSRGGGVDTTLGLLEALIKDPLFNVRCLVSSDNDKIKSYEKLADQALLRVRTGGFSFTRLIMRTLTLQWVDLLKSISKAKPDYILITMFHPWCAFILLFQRLLFATTPIIYIRHNPKNFQSNASLANHLILALDDFCTRRATYVITHSEYVRNRIAQDYSLKNVHNIGFGASQIYNAKKRQLQCNVEPIHLLFFGRILPYKGLGTLLEAALILDSQSINFTLTIAGEGQIDVPPALETALKLPQVNLLNHWISDIMLDHLLDRSHVIIAPYNEASQSGPVNIAVACGIPLIVTNVGGLPELVSDSNTGYVVAPNNPTLLAEKTALLARTPGLLEALSTNTIKLANTHNTWEHSVRRLKDTVLSNLPKED